MERWNLEGDPEVIMVNVRVTHLSASWTLKRGKYQSDSVEGTMSAMPPNLVVSVPVYKPLAEVKEAGSDLAILGEVYRKLMFELGLRTQQMAADHIRLVYPEIQEDKPRVGASERRERTEQPVDYT